MRTFISGYKNNFIGLLDSIVATGAEQKHYDVDDAVEKTCVIIKDQALLGGKVILIGNGGSAAIAGHMAIDFWKNGGIPSICFNDGPLLTCIGNDFGYHHVFEKPIEMFARGVDVLIAISSSGKSENIIRGVQAAAARGCSVVTMSGFESNNPLRSLGVCNFYVPVDQYGPVEVIHQYICHWILDSIIEGKNINSKNVREINK